MFSNTLSFLSSRNVNDQVSHPYKTTGKIIILYINIYIYIYSKINYGLHSTGEKEKRTPRKTWMEGVQVAITTRNLEPDHWRNREEWLLVSGRRRQLLKTGQIDRISKAILLANLIHTSVVKSLTLTV